jgi:hypothetical protein
LIASVCVSCEPCDIFMRTAFTPEVIIDSMIDCVLEDGPSVARIFALLIGVILA